MTVTVRIPRAPCSSRRPHVPILLAASLLFPALLPALAIAGPNGTPHLLLHARPVSAAQACDAGIDDCAAAQVSGGLYQPSGAGSYFVYLMAARFEPETGVRQFRVGLSYDPTTGSGVDIFQWHLCADAETPESGWYSAGGANRLAWSVDACPPDSLVVGGYFYLTAYTAGHLALNAPGTGSAEFVTCAGAPVSVATSELGYVGFGGLNGCNPCLAPCNYVSVEPTTWSGVKALLRPRAR
jgi:hypothetical protein